MISKLLVLLFSLLILACPFNCMQSSAEDMETAKHSCCSHCQPHSPENPLAPVPASSDCCQCFCSGTILENASQLEQTSLTVFWFVIPLQADSLQLNRINQQTDIILLDVVPPSGRALRCLQMSFQC